MHTYHNARLHCNLVQGQQRAIDRMDAAIVHLELRWELRLGRGCVCVCVSDKGTCTGLVCPAQSHSPMLPQRTCI